MTSIARPFTKDLPPNSKGGRVEVQPVLSFSDEDKIGTMQPHDDALVITLKIGGYDVKGAGRSGQRCKDHVP